MSHSADEEKTKRRNRRKIKDLLRIKPSPVAESIANNEFYKYSEKELAQLSPAFSPGMVLKYRNKANKTLMRVLGAQDFKNFANRYLGEAKMTDDEFMKLMFKKNTVLCSNCCNYGPRNLKPEPHVEYVNLAVVNESGEKIGSEYHVCEFDLVFSKQHNK